MARRKSRSRTVRRTSKPHRTSKTRRTRTARRTSKSRRTRTARRPARRTNSPRRTARRTKSLRRTKEKGRKYTSRKARVVSDILSSSYGVKGRAQPPPRQGSMDAFLSGISSVSPKGDAYDLDAWMPGKKTETSGPYGLENVYKENEKGYKKQKVHKVESEPYQLDKLFKEQKKSKKKKKKKESKKSGGFFGFF